MIVRTMIDDLPYVVEVPDTAREEDYGNGLVLGPPIDLLTDLDLPDDIARRLHKELFARDLITYADVFTRKHDVIAAIQSVLKLDSERIVEVYSGNK